MSNTSQYDAIFSSVIGQDYDMLQLICPAATEMSRLVGNTVLAYPNTAKPLQAFELGGEHHHTGFIDRQRRHENIQRR